CLGEGTLTLAAAEDASLATLGHISRNGANVASVHQPIMGTVRVGARLAPVLGFAQRPILRSRGCVIHTYRMVGLFSFSKYYRLSTRNGGLEIFATGTSGLIHANFRDHPGSAMQHRYVRNASDDHLLAFALLAALRTGVMLGLDRLVLNIIGLAADYIGESHRGSS